MSAAATGQLFDAGAVPPVSLADRFGVPPFSTLDTRQGYWQQRRRQWLALGIRSELGRHPALIGGLASASGGGTEMLAQKHERQRVGAYGAQATTDPHTGELRYEVTTGATSIFDPVLCELAVRWHTCEGATILDPFAGGSVRGIVAAMLGRHYVGIDLAGRQLDANRQQWADIAHRYGLPDHLAPRWIEGDAAEVLAPPDSHGVGAGYDLVWTCPPYADLEQYTDDPRDLSQLDYPAFREQYATILARAAAHLAPHRFMGLVVSEVRDRHGTYRGLVPDTVRACEAAGLAYYNEAVLINAAGSAPVRAARTFGASRKLIRLHQNVLWFVAGSPKAATRWAAEPGDTDLPDDAGGGRAAAGWRVPTPPARDARPVEDVHLPAGPARPPPPPAEALDLSDLPF